MPAYAAPPEAGGAGTLVAGGAAEPRAAGGGSETPVRALQDERTIENGRP